MLDKRTAKANLLKKEMQNVKRMLNNLLRARFRKIVRKASKGEKIQSNVLTAEEEKIYTGFSSMAEAYWSFAKNIIRGHVPKVDVRQEHKRTVLRFLKDIPAIIGADMKTHGPFRIEDVASLPVENARVLVKQGLAEKVEAN
jgi:DNA replication initiation complex subunit (GINS family)